MSNIRSFKRTETNPFVLELKGKMYLQPRANTIVAKGEAIYNTLSGEVKEDVVLLGRRKTVDKSQFAKVYVSELGILMGLSKTAINVLIYLMGKMDYDNKVIFQYSSEYHKLNYKSKNPCYKAIIELLENNILALHDLEGIYWLNPIYVCKGERFAMYTEYVTEEYAEQERKEIQRKQIENEQKALNDVSYKISAMNQQDDVDYNRIQELESELNQLRNKHNQFKNL